MVARDENDLPVVRSEVEGEAAGHKGAGANDYYGARS